MSGPSLICGQARLYEAQTSRFQKFPKMLGANSNENEILITTKRRIIFAKKKEKGKNNNESEKKGKIAAWRDEESRRNCFIQKKEQFPSSLYMRKGENSIKSISA